MMLTNADLLKLQKAIQKDYGIKLDDSELYGAAYNLLKLFENLIQHEKNDRKVRKSS